MTLYYPPALALALVSSLFPSCLCGVGGEAGRLIFVRFFSLFVPTLDSPSVRSLLFSLSHACSAWYPWSLAWLMGVRAGGTRGGRGDEGGSQDRSVVYSEKENESAKCHLHASHLSNIFLGFGPETRTRTEMGSYHISSLILYRGPVTLLSSLLRFSLSSWTYIFCLFLILSLAPRKIVPQPSKWLARKQENRIPRCGLSD